MNQNQEKKNSYRSTSIIVGVLFILATATAILGMLNIGSLLDSKDLFPDIASNETKIVVSVILYLILAISVMGIGFLMYPILKKQDDGLAMGYVVFRSVESILIIIACVSLLALLTISQEFVDGDLDVNYFEPIGMVLKSIQEWSFIIGTLIFLGLGGMVLNYQLFKLNLVPRWLSGWGFIGATLVMIYGFISLFGYDPSFLAIAIAFQEMVFALWIIIKGFNTSEMDTKVIS